MGPKARAAVEVVLVWLSDVLVGQSSRQDNGVLVTAALLGRNGRGDVLTWIRTNNL